MQSPLLLVALLLTALSMGGVAANELSHGSVAEIMGFGHRHMSDTGGYHCADHDDARHAQAHMQHMHEDHALDHTQCPGGPHMHRPDGSMHGGGGPG